MTFKPNLIIYHCTTFDRHEKNESEARVWKQVLTQNLTNHSSNYAWSDLPFQLFQMIYFLLKHLRTLQRAKIYYNLIFCNWLYAIIDIRYVHFHGIQVYIFSDTRDISTEIIKVAQQFRTIEHYGFTLAYNGLTEFIIDVITSWRNKIDITATYTATGSNNV